MGSIVPKGPWTGPLNWDLHGTIFGETRIPFAHYTRRQSALRSTRTFPQFLGLPSEIQAHILSFCDSATLFWLSHASSTTRGEAQKLFWTNPYAWYRTEGSWLLAGGYSGHTSTAVDALVHVKQVEVDFGALNPLARHKWEDGACVYAPRSMAIDIEARTHAFWHVLQRRFPCASHVVLSETVPLKTGLLLPAGLKEIAERCPASIVPSISFLHEEVGYPKRLQRSRWQLASGHSRIKAEWEMVNAEWIRDTVLPPLKDFRGPIGAYSLWIHNGTHSLYLRRARRLLLLQATAAYYLQNPHVLLICPVPHCALRFDLREEWVSHAIDAGHNSDITPPSEPLQVLFAQHEAKIAHIRQKGIDMLTRMRIDWGKEGSKQREVAKHAFLNQLQHDPLYTHELSPEESSIWGSYQQDMNNEPYIG